VQLGRGKAVKIYESPLIELMGFWKGKRSEIQF